MSESLGDMQRGKGVNYFCGQRKEHARERRLHVNTDTQKDHDYYQRRDMMQLDQNENEAGDLEPTNWQHDGRTEWLSEWRQEQNKKREDSREWVSQKSSQELEKRNSNRFALSLWHHQRAGHSEAVEKNKEVVLNTSLIRFNWNLLPFSITTINEGLTGWLWQLYWQQKEKKKSGWGRRWDLLNHRSDSYWFEQTSERNNIIQIPWKRKSYSYFIKCTLLMVQKKEQWSHRLKGLVNGLNASNGKVIISTKDDPNRFKVGPSN